MLHLLYQHKGQVISTVHKIVEGSKEKIMRLA